MARLYGTPSCCWADFARLRRQVAAQCAAAGLTGTRLDDFVLAVHEIAANAIVHAGAGGRLILRRAAVFFGWLIAFMISMACIGLIPTVPIFVIGYMRLEGRERWRLVLPQAISLTLFIYIVFDQLLSVPWPATWPRRASAHPRDCCDMDVAAGSCCQAHVRR